MRKCLALLGLVCAPAWAADHSITFACCSYSPANLTITAGDRVTWTGSFGSHPLLQVTGPASDTPVAGGFAQSGGSSLTLTFNDPGEIFYECTFHGVAQAGGLMRGRITVQSGDGVFDDGFEGGTSSLVW